MTHAGARTCLRTSTHTAEGRNLVSYDPQQPGRANPVGGPNPGGFGWPGGPLGSDAFPPPGTAYQPPEGTHPGGNVPPAQQGQPYPGAYPPPPEQAPYYGYGAYPGPMPASTSPWAIASLILSIASWLVIPVVGAIAGVICGHIALNEINRSEGRVEGRGMAVAGLIIGYVHIAAALCAGALFLVVIFGALNQLH